MSKGTDGPYWDDRNLPSELKHALLRCYIPKFGGMTGSRGERQVVYFDGFAGEGRYENGKEGSAEIAMQVAAHHGRMGLRWKCFFTETSTKSAARPEEVAASYRVQGADAVVRRGKAGALIDEVVGAGVGKPLFLFLDPCGLTLPFDQLAQVLARQRRPARGTWPPTELLMNFSMTAVRRLGGNARSDKGVEKAMERFDEVCGGRWWREYFAGDLDSEDATQAVAAGYAARLRAATGMYVESIPVAKDPFVKPTYHLVFATRSQHGLWGFGHCAAQAREKWWERVETVSNAQQPSLFPIAPDPEEVREKALPVIAGNIARILERSPTGLKLVHHAKEVFGPFYGQVTESVARDAVKRLHKEGGTTTDGKGEKHVHNVIARPPRR